MFRDTAAQDQVLDRPPVWRRHPVLIAVAVVAVIALALAVPALLRVSGISASVDLSRVTVASVERGLFVRDFAAEGKVVAAGSPMLYAPAAGTVSLSVQAGDRVTKGQPLAHIDSPDLNAKLSQEQASLQSQQFEVQRAQLDANRRLMQLTDAYAQAQVDQKTAQRELDRSRKAYELGAYSELQALRTQDALDKANSALEQAKKSLDVQPDQNRFDVQSKKAQLARQQVTATDLARQVDALNLLSPVDGQVGQLQVADRAYVAKDAALLSVVDLTSLEVEIQVPESFARDLAPGMNAELTGNGGRWQGILGGVSPEVVGGQVVARVRFAAEKPTGLRQNQRLSVRILIDRRDKVLMVDRGSFVDQDAGHVYVVRDDIATRQPIRLGASSISKVEILDGLAEGDRIVVSGADAFNGAERIILSH